mgnify:CR=1 FL=1
MRDKILSAHEESLSLKLDTYGSRARLGITRGKTRRDREERFN